MIRLFEFGIVPQEERRERFRRDWDGYGQIYAIALSPDEKYLGYWGNVSRIIQIDGVYSEFLV